jgi:16S rRNA (cytidine1402-2'-O)-methyltransferase
MSGTLYVVATPIGNLEDITLRALRVLREASVVAAEDTRRTAKLLTHYSITTRTISFHEHNARIRVPGLISRLEAGEDIAVVTDAGTPGVSDPGLELVVAAIQKGIRVDPVPGASAPLTALIGSGFPLAPFTVFGFPPNRGTDRKEWWQSASEVDHTFCFFEAPHRIRKTLNEAAIYLVNRPMSVGRELTKVHQEFRRASALELADGGIEARGEFTIVVGPAVVPKEMQAVSVSDDLMAGEFGQLTNNGAMTRRVAISMLAKKYGRSARDVYSAIERGKLVG